MLGWGWGLMLFWCHGWGFKQLQKASIPHPYHMYTECFSTLICCGWTYGCTLTLLCRCRWGLILEVWVWLRANGCVVSWLILQTASDYIPHPYHMYKKCFSTLICCGWTYGCTLTLLYQCRWGWILESSSVGECEWCCGVMVEATNSFKRHPTSISYV